MTTPTQRDALREEKCDNCGCELEQDELTFGLCVECLDDVANEDGSWGAHEYY